MDAEGQKPTFSRALPEVRSAPASGHLGCRRLSPLWTDCVEKVLSGVGTNFLRAAGALGVLRRGGTARVERIRSAAFPRTLRGHRQPKSAISSLLREFR